MIFIRKAVIVNVFFCTFLNLVKAQTTDSIFNSILYNGIVEKNGIIISLIEDFTPDELKIPLVLFSNRISEIERSADSVMINEEDIVVFDIIFGEPFLVNSKFFEKTGILKDSVHLRIDALKDLSIHKIKNLNCSPYTINIYCLDAFFIKFEIEQSSLKRYLNELNIIPIYSESKIVHVGLLIDEKSELARLLKKNN